MRFQLTLIPSTPASALPANYQYPLSGAIYKIIQQADEKYSAFLHDTGYKLNSGKSFKLFSFSELKVPYRIQGDRFVLNGAPATLTIGFHIDEAAGNFIKGLFKNQQIEIADKISGARFSVNEVQLLKDILATINKDPAEMMLQPISPLVVGRKNERGNYDFLSPADPDFAEWLIFGWLEKYKAIRNEADTENLKSQISVQLVTPITQIKSRLITIKAFTPQQTKIRGFTNFRLKIKAPKPLLELALNAGMGLYTAMGCGCVTLVKVI
ncbi:MAG TPA: CRISPR-associated endoribonuclease Cas6 [Chitinophagaceae bacterium]|nr:CRISPR-associated endoribonuclease Cas6 [Chitinophagaceae bacterium]